MTIHSYFVFEGGDGHADASLGHALFEIEICHSGRQWLQVRYVSPGIEPIIPAVIIPAGPDDFDSVVDACILFYPQHFRSCSSMAAVVNLLRGSSEPLRGLDFHHGHVPQQWFKLREEARPLMAELTVLSCELNVWVAPRLR